MLPALVVLGRVWEGLGLLLVMFYNCAVWVRVSLYIPLCFTFFISAVHVSFIFTLGFLSSLPLAGFIFLKFSYGLVPLNVKILLFLCDLSACDFCRIYSLGIGLVVFSSHLLYNFFRISQSKLYVIVKWNSCACFSLNFFSCLSFVCFSYYRNLQMLVSRTHLTVFAYRFGKRCQRTVFLLWFSIIQP